VKSRIAGSWIITLLLSVAAWAAPKVPDGVTYEPELEYGKAGEESLKLDLARPADGEGPFPAVVVIHGGAWRGGHRSAHTDLVLQLAQRGYVAATISYRFCPKHAFPAQVEDAKCAVRFLRANGEKYKIDKDRIGAVGASAGAHLAMMLGVMDKEDGLEGSGGSPEQSSKVQAVVGFFGPTDLLADDMPQPTRPLIKDFIGGTPGEKPQEHRRASPLTYVTKGDAPILMLQGTKDPLVPHTQAFKMAEAMTAAGVPGRVEVYVGAGHGWGGKELGHSIRQTFEFLDQHLKP
jgi:acetyl esterase/lipase